MQMARFLARMKNEVRGCIVRHNAGPGDDFFQETIPTTQAAVANLYKNRRSGQSLAQSDGNCKSTLFRFAFEIL